jgi:hypothetical protein
LIEGKKDKVNGLLAVVIEDTGRSQKTMEIKQMLFVSYISSRAINQMV